MTSSSFQSLLLVLKLVNASKYFKIVMIIMRLLEFLKSDAGLA